MADTVAIGLRILAYAAALQAAGMVLFASLFGRDLDRSRPAIHAMALAAAAAGLLLTLAHGVTEAARLTGELRGILDGSMQALLLSSAFGTAIALRALGLAMILCGLLRPSRLGETAGLLGASLVVVSFAFTGHTAAHDQRWLLAPLLIIHLLVVAFWFGALWPLLRSTSHETPAAAGALTQRFSRIAVRLVPLILLAGVAMSALVLPDLSSLAAPYGLALLAKLAGFSLLMGLAALNRSRLGPGISTGRAHAVLAFRCSVLIEWLLIFAVVGVTAVMTALYSPD